MGTQTGTSANDTLTGGGGDDVAFGGAGNDTVYGGDGDDLSYGGTGNDALFGGNGNDANAGEKGDDAMYGGAGRDTLVGGQGHDTMYGGSDNDTMLGDGQWLNLAEYASGSGGKATNLTLTNSADGPIDLYQINGSGNSVYVATIQPGQTLVQSTTTTTNWILRDPDGYYLEPIAGASNQTVNYGPDLSDTMYGGTGDDHIRSQYGNDMVYGDDGNDAVRAGYGHDVVYGGIGNDTLYGDAGNDTIYGDAGNDTAYGGTGDDKIGSHGADSAGNDTLYGGDGNDSLIGGSENDVLYGDAGNDTLAGGVGADTLYGGADADTFAVTEDHQTDTIYGGETGNDNDAIVLTNYVTTQGVNVAFTGSEAGSYSYYGGGASGSFTGIEAIWSTAYNDTIDASASSSAQTLGAGAGDDTVTGSSGANMIYGGDGNDSLYGGAGNDTLQGDAGNDTVYAGSGDDTVYGGVGSDTLFGGTGDDSMVGGSGNDTLYGDDGNDVINGDAGNDTVYGGAGNDTVSSTVGNDLIYGGDGADNLSGGDGADTIYGGTGNDALTGGDGNDALFGGLGDDSLSGGGGADMFGVAGGEGADTISGGETGVDADTLEFTTGGVGNGVTITFTGTEAGTFSYAGGGSGTFTEVETVAGSAGGDTIDATAASGPVSIFGGDGRDTISGGTGNDHLDAGAGNDTLDGGAGNDTLTTGSGNDSIAMDRFGGADRVTDFSLTDTDHDGHYDDQIDASDLTNGQGGPVTAWDVVVTDDGFGNALLTFPEGETLILQGVPPGAMATVAQRHAAGIPCFTAGTLIATLRGEVAVETQRPGDLVTTRDQGPQPVVWTARRHLSAAGLLARPDLVPVRLTRAFTGTGRNLLVSPQHAMLIGRGRDEVLVRAIHLARLDGNQVRRAAGVREVIYVHLMFARHQIITANGTPSESFYPGPCSLAMLDAGALVSLARAFPRLGVSGAAFAYGPTARPVLRMADLPPTLNAVLAGQGLRAAQFAC